jgi:DNA-binding MarR family transcriptional regulator
MAPRRPIRRKQHISPLEAHLGYWLRFVSNHVSHAFGTKLSGRDVTVAEWVVLRELYEHDTVAPSKVAFELRMTRGAISKLVDRLCGKGLVTKAHAEGDRRYQEIGLTTAGRAIVPELAELADDNDEHFFGHLASDERTNLESVLKEIVRHHRLTTIPVE